MSVIHRSLELYGQHCKIATVPGDGNCMLHSLAFCACVPYHTGIFNGKKITKVQVAELMRQELFDKLDENYRKISGGEYAKTSEFIDETKFSNLKKLFSSKNMLGEETKVYIEFLIEKNILIIDAHTGKLNSKMGYDKSKFSCVLYYTSFVDEEGNDSGHYEPVIWFDKLTGKNNLVFTHEHEFMKRMMR